MPLDAATMSLNREQVERIRWANRLEDVVAGYTQLRPGGRNRLKGLCPFHREESPSFVVYTDQQSWWCYGCQAGSDIPGGQDVFKFLMLAEKVSFPEAVDRLSAGVPTDMPVPVPPPVAAREDPALTDAHLHLLTTAAEVYHTHLLAYAPALDYLAGRGLDMEAVRRHRIGYAAGDRLRKYLRFKGWDEELAAELRLIEEKHGTEHLRNRLVIPEWRDERVVYLAGRALGSFNPKYLFLDGAPKPLYGLEYIQDQPQVFITEGLFDWLALIQWGYPAACLLGTWLKKTHQPHFDHASRIYLAFDNDESGREAASRLMELWPDRAVELRLPDAAKDVGELGERPGGREVFEAVVEAADMGNR